MPVGVTVFDGADCIGGNKIYLEFKGGKFDKKGIFFDFGMNFRRYGEYYEEFLTPRPGRGIHDLRVLGIIPDISCYRPDLIPSDLSLNGARTLDPLAIFVSHAHMDHIGNIGLLDRNIPAIATPMSAAIMKAMQDCGAKMESEVAYITLRESAEGEGRLVESTHYKKGSFQGRAFCLTAPCQAGSVGGGLDSISPFWCSQPTARKLKAGTLAVAPGSLELEFRSFDVDHSMYGATAYAVNSDAGWIVYSGDLRLHGKFRGKTTEFVNEAKKLSPELLIIEGTRASREERVESEDEVFFTCIAAVEAETKLVIADFAARNFERLDLFREIAKRTGRELVVMMMDAYLLDAMQCVDGEDRMRDLSIYRDLKASRDGFEKQVMAQHASKLLDPLDLAKDPGHYILCFSFFDIKHLLDIKTGGGTYIYSSSEAFSEEQRIDFVRLSNWLRWFRFTEKGFSVDMAGDTPVVSFERGYHASGHASGQDIIGIIREINPAIVMPVHTEKPGFFVENCSGMNVLVPEHGREYFIGDF